MDLKTICWSWKSTSFEVYLKFIVLGTIKRFLYWDIVNPSLPNDIQLIIEIKEYQFTMSRKLQTIIPKTACQDCL